MNLDNNPTIEELKKLFAGADDEAGNNVLWVDNNGKVHLSVVPEELTPVGFEEQTPSMKMRYETFGQGNGYVGEGAAADDKFMGDVFRNLVREWRGPFENGQVKYVG